MKTVKGNIVDIPARRIYNGEISIEGGKIQKIFEYGPEDVAEPYIMPGFIDAHVHTESCMLTPDEFARVAALNGTVAAVVDPHEIANVLGVEGVKYLIDNASHSPFHFCFGVPSCVPSTCFETAGAALDHKAVEQLLDMNEVTHLSEVMNVPAVLSGDEDMMLKLQAAQQRGKPIDGHEPNLVGEDLYKYADCGITTNHECTRLDVALENIKAGISVIIREGSAAKDYEALHPLLADHSDSLMFCTDDCHPDYLKEGPIKLLVKHSLSNGYNLWSVLRAACVNPVNHYKTGTGLLQEGDSADFIIVNNLEEFDVRGTCLGGEIYDSAHPLPVDRAKYSSANLPNHFEHAPISVCDLRITPSNPQSIKVIGVSDGSIISENLTAKATMEGDNAVSDTSRDILKIIVLNRYEKNSVPAIGFVHGFKLREGALASSVAHDSHNIVCIGTSDEYIAKAVNAVIERKGGLVCVGGDGTVTALALPVGGICSAASFESVLEDYERTRDAARQAGSPFRDAFMTMSFLALPVIPWLKLTDKGLFDYSTFSLTTI